MLSSVVPFQIDELKKQLLRSDDEKSRLKSHIDHQEEAVNNRIRKLACMCTANGIDIANGIDTNHRTCNVDTSHRASYQS